MAKKNNKRDANGLIAVEVSWNDEQTGKRMRKKVYGKTQKDADEKAEVLRLMHRKGIDLSTLNDSFGIWKNRLLSLKKFEVSPTWYNSLESTVKHLEVFDNTELCKIKSIDFQNHLYLLATGDANLSQKTLKTIKSFAQQVFQLAIDNRVLDYNPITVVKVPKKASAIERRALTDDEQRWIIDTPHRCQIAAMIMMFSGLRRGELIPLTWSDINFHEHTLTVNKFVEIIDGQSRLKDYGKSASAVRTIHIPQILCDYLDSQPRKSINICTSVDGKMLSETAFKRMWESYMGELNRKYGKFDNYMDNMPNSKFAPKKLPRVIPPITAHWLRHTFATMLYHAGVDVLTARDQLGHSDIKTTLNIYTHLDKIYKTNSMTKFDNYVTEKLDATSMPPVDNLLFP